jgi:hypothetical protein
MSSPIPSNSIRPLKTGEKVQILAKFQDDGDEQFERIVIEAPEDSPRVLIRTLIPGMAIQPTETVEASMLERVIDLGPYGELAPEIVIADHLGDLPRETRLWLVEKFPDEVMATGKFTPEEADLCAQLHPSIAVRRAAQHLSDERIRELAESHPFVVLLHASERVDPEQLRQLAAVHPGTCVVILEKNPESRLRYSLRAIAEDGINPNVAAALAAVSQPGG